MEAPSLHQTLWLENIGFQQYIALHPWAVDLKTAYKRYKAAEVEMLPDQRKFQRESQRYNRELKDLDDPIKAPWKVPRLSPNRPSEAEF